jgi:hypothetical protein
LGFAFVFLNLLTQLDSSTRLPLLLFDLAILVGKPFRVWQNVLAWSLIESFFFLSVFQRHQIFVPAHNLLRSGTGFLGSLPCYLVCVKSLPPEPSFLPIRV